MKALFRKVDVRLVENDIWEMIPRSVLITHRKPQTNPKIGSMKIEALLAT